VAIAMTTLPAIKLRWPAAALGLPWLGVGAETIRPPKPPAAPGGCCGGSFYPKRP